jgi:hypothetical protein
LAQTSFAVSPFEDWSPDGKADLIIFNESIAYTTGPADIVRSYRGKLNPGGRIIISMHEYGNHRAIWKRIGLEMEFVSGARIENQRKQAWNVRMFAPRAGVSA